MDKQRRKQQWIAWALFSVGVHLLLIWLGLPQLYFQKQLTKAKPVQQFEVQLAPPQKKKEPKKFIPYERKTKEKAEKPKYLAKHDFKAKKETVNKNLKSGGKVAKNEPKPIPKPTKAPTIQRGHSKNLAMLFPDKLFDQMDREYQEQDQTYAQGDPGLGGAVVDYVDKIDLGDETLLNSASFKYYGYFSQMRKRVRQNWVSNINSAAYRTYLLGQPLESDDRHETKILLVLSRTGIIKEVKVIKSSGNRQLDEASINAFIESHSFPNPPKDLFKSKEKIAITWSFLVKVS